MNRIPKTVFVLVAAMCAAWTLQTAHAGQPPESGAVPAQLIIELPDIDRETLIAQVNEQRSRLIERKQALLQVVANHELDGGDALITAIMPGGLLYAGYKKARHRQAKTELQHVSADIEELSGDIAAIQTGTTPVVVARLP